MKTFTQKLHTALHTALLENDDWTKEHTQQPFASSSLTGNQGTKTPRTPPIKPDFNKYFNYDAQKRTKPGIPIKRTDLPITIDEAIKMIKYANANKRKYKFNYKNKEGENSNLLDDICQIAEKLQTIGIPRPNPEIPTTDLPDIFPDLNL